jgi:hypothetical protein
LYAFAKQSNDILTNCYLPQNPFNNKLGRIS